MAKRDFLAVSDLTRDEILRLFDLAGRIKSGAYREAPLAGKTLAMIFAKSSTRTRVSFEVRLACPEGYEPSRAIFERALAASACLSITEAPEEAVEGAHVVSTDVWASMGQEEEAEARRNAFRGYTVDPDLMKLADPKAIFLHCLPAHRGEEVTADVIEGPQSRVWTRPRTACTSRRRCSRHYWVRVGEDQV